MLQCFEMNRIRWSPRDSNNNPPRGPPIWSEISLSGVLAGGPRRVCYSWVDLTSFIGPASISPLRAGAMTLTTNSANPARQILQVRSSRPDWNMIDDVFRTSSTCLLTFLLALWRWNVAHSLYRRCPTWLISHLSGERLFLYTFSKVKSNTSAWARVVPSASLHGSRNWISFFLSVGPRRIGRVSVPGRYSSQMVTSKSTPQLQCLKLQLFRCLIRRRPFWLISMPSFEA